MAARPGSRLTVYLPPGAAADAGAAELRPLPGRRLLGRHLEWPARLRRLGAHAYFGPAGLLPLGRVGMPSVLAVHDLAIYRNPAWFPGGQLLSTRLVVPSSLRRAERLAAVSASTARDLGELFGVGGSRVRVVHPGVAAAFRPSTPEAAARLRSSLGLPERFVLFVGAIEPRKNLATLLRGWAELPERPPLAIAGGWGWRYEEVRGLVEKLGEDVRLLGAVEPARLPALYAAATCLAHPAWYEGFGLTPLEAMACGTPVVCSDASSLPEVVGDAALLVDPGDVGGWRAALERVLGDAGLRAELSRKGLARASRFSWERTADGIWGALEEAVRDRSG
jgi:glycosyltransferase involved in cell wall biosynthesis